MKLLLIGLLMLLCGCTAEPYAEMEAIPTTVEENWILSYNYARREESHLPEGATSYTLPLRSDSRNTMCFEDWSLQRYYDGQWYDMQNCGGELDHSGELPGCGRRPRSDRAGVSASVIRILSDRCLD